MPVERQEPGSRAAAWAAPSVPVWLPGVVVLVVAAIARVARRDLWLDEAFSLAATHRLSETLQETHGTMALYYAALTPWSAVSQSPAWLRSLSIVFLAFGVAMFAVTIARQAGRTAGGIAGLLAGCSPIVIRYAVEARSFALVVLLTSVGWYALDRAMEDDRSPRWPALVGVTAVLLPLAHGLAIIQVGAMFAAVAWARPPVVLTRRLLVGFVAAGLVIAALIAGGASEVGNWVPGTSMAGTVRFLTDIVHPFAPVAGLLIGLAAMGTARLAQENASDPITRFRQVTPILWGPGAAVGLIVLSAVRPSLLSRYGLAAALGVAALASIGLIQTKRFTPLLTAAVAALMLISQLANTEVVPTWTRAVAIVDNGSEPGDAIAFGAPDARIPFEAAWTDHPDPPPLDRVGPGQPLGTYDRFGSVSETEELIEDVLGRRRVWVVDQPYEHQASRFDELMDDPRVTDRFVVVERWQFPTEISNIEILLLEAR